MRAPNAIHDFHVIRMLHQTHVVNIELVLFAALLRTVSQHQLDSVNMQFGILINVVDVALNKFRMPHGISVGFKNYYYSSLA